MAISQRRGTLAGSLTLSAALAITMAGTPARATTAPAITVSGNRTQPQFSYAAAIREHVMVESSIDSDSDGSKDRVRVDIIRPKESADGLKVPVIIDESPYYDNAGRGNESERKTYDAAGNPVKFPLFYDNYFVPRGYAVLNVDMIGTTGSDGCPTSGGAPDVLGGKAVIDWLNGRAKAYRADGSAATATWATGKAAMIGKSYDGTLANGVAATGVRGLETIVPISAISSWYNYSRMNGVRYFTDEQPFLADFVDTDPPEKCAAVRAALDAGEDDATGNYNDYWRETDYLDGTVADVDKVRASVFAVHTTNDLNVKPNHFSTWWRALAERGVPRKVWLGKYAHVDPFDFRREQWVDTLHRWFDFWLYGIQNGIMSEPRADVQLDADTWVTQRDWPAPRAVNLPLRPTAAGGLGLTGAPGGATGSFVDVRLSEDAMVADPTAAHPNRLAYVTPALPADVRLSGTPTVDLRVKLDRPDANLTALVVDYGTDTRVDPFTRDGITTLTEESCHGQSTAADDACYRTTVTNTATREVEIVARGWIDVQNRLSLTDPSPLPVGTYGRVRWRTLPHDYVFKAGHRLALVLAGNDGDYTDEDPTGATVTVDLAGSRVILPVTLDRALTAADLARDKDGWRGPIKVDLPVQPDDLH